MAGTPRILASGFADESEAVSLVAMVPSHVGPREHALALYAPESGHGWRQVMFVSGEPPSTGPAR